MKDSVLTISIDFEMGWGMIGNKDRTSIESLKDTYLGVQDVVPKLLNLFGEYGIHATWDIVGFLFFRDYIELLKSLPEKIPKYKLAELNPYDWIGEDSFENRAPFLFASPLIQLIKNTPHQEIATHTFSHYYCLEMGQDKNTFKADLEAALKIARQNDIRISSIVFPRNEVNESYLHICKEQGIEAFRGNQTSWIYDSKNSEDDGLHRRLSRLLDAYLPLTGHNTYSLEEINSNLPYNIRASRFLRPFSPLQKALEPLRLRRIISNLRHASKCSEVYHLWWHPHNFVSHQKENFAFLQRILDEFSLLREQSGMRSLTMRELCRELEPRE